eukprot:806016-Pleurochrysis_carterae.AAC.1
MALLHLQGLVNNNVKLSRRMLALLPPANRDGESEGEEAELSDSITQLEESKEDGEAGAQ